MALRTCSNPKVKFMFPLRREVRDQKTRFTEKYIVNKANTHRLKTSAIPYMQGLINKHERKSARWT